MQAFSLNELSKVLNAKPHGDDVIFHGVTIDSRQMNPGELFVAIKGENFDGHDFIEQAKQKGAAAIICSESHTIAIPSLKVKDTRIALGQLAALHRQQFQTPVIGLTGSCGKTTTKAMLAAILQQQHQVLAPVASMNNDIGLPLTLLQLTPQHQFAVIEMGTNHFGEIAYLTKIAQPNIAVVTNIGPVHLEYLGDLDGVARAKGEIFQGLKADGIAVLNIDDPYTKQLMQTITNKSCVTFGCSKAADIRGQNIQLTAEGHAQFELQINNTVTKIQLPTLGQHNVYNALAAAAAAFAAGISLADIYQGLETMQPVPKRLVKKTAIKDATIIDDSYSANPSAVKAALQTLAHGQGKKVFVFGAMGELNPNHAERLHQEIGEQAKSLGIDNIYAMGELTKHTVSAFGKGAKYFENKEDLITTLKEQLNSDVTVLVKGSRFMAMEQVVNAIEKGQ